MNDVQRNRIDRNLLTVFEALMLEGSVAGAAARLNKTLSAVSHALGKLCDQVEDPLTIKVDGWMHTSPFALVLFKDVQPILSSIKRVLKLPNRLIPSPAPGRSASPVRFQAGYRSRRPAPRKTPL